MVSDKFPDLEGDDPSTGSQSLARKRSGGVPSFAPEIGLGSDPSTAWMEDAACIGRTDEFFSGDEDTIEEARKVCLLECPVLDDCRAHHEAHPLEFGVVAGLRMRDRLHSRTAGRHRAILRGES